MAIIVSTPAPKAVIANLKSEIKNGRAHTWIHSFRPTEPWDSFSHNGEDNRLLFLASFSPTPIVGGVIFNLFSPGGRPVEHGIWGVYHGRFVELILNHGGDSVEDVLVTPKPMGSDVQRKSKPLPTKAPTIKPLAGSGGKVTPQMLSEIVARLRKK